MIRDIFQSNVIKTYFHHLFGSSKRVRTSADFVWVTAAAVTMDSGFDFKHSREKNAGSHKNIVLINYRNLGVEKP